MFWGLAIFSVFRQIKRTFAVQGQLDKSLDIPYFQKLNPGRFIIDVCPSVSSF